METLLILAADPAGYPRDNSFLVYTIDEAPPQIGKLLDDAMVSTAGRRIEDFLRATSRSLCNSLDSTNQTGGDGEGDHVVGDVDMEVDDQSSSRASDDSDTSLQFDYGDEDDFGLNDKTLHGLGTKTDDATLRQIRQDFRIARDAGFKVGKICGVEEISASSIMTMSVKISKLDLSEETHTAWNLEPSDYLVLLMKYSGGYVSFEEALETPAERIHLDFRLRKCSTYRPTIEDAIEAFSPANQRRDTQEPEVSAMDEDNSPKRGELLGFGVGGSLELLLCRDFFTMLKLRKSEYLGIAPFLPGSTP